MTEKLKKFHKYSSVKTRDMNIMFSDVEHDAGDK